MLLFLYYFGVDSEDILYGPIEKSLTEVISSIDGVEFSDGEWKVNFVNFIFPDFLEDKKCIMIADKGIMTVDKGDIYLKYNSRKVALKDFNEDNNSIRKGIRRLLKKDELIIKEGLSISEFYEYDEFIDRLNYFFDNKNELIDNWFIDNNDELKSNSDDTCITYDGLVCSNSKKDVYEFDMHFIYLQNPGELEPENIRGISYKKYIFKKIK